MRSTTEKAALLALGISLVGSVAWWSSHDFWRTGVFAYVPFLSIPITAAFYWVARERRLRAQVTVWETLLREFPNKDFPAGALDPKQEGVGWMEVRGGTRVGAVRTLPGREGIHMQMAWSSGRYTDKLIPWHGVARIVHVPERQLREFGPVSLSYASIRFTSPRDLGLVIPWRETFDLQVPEHVGIQQLGRSGAN